MNEYKRGSEWGRWDLHLHTASSYDYLYKAHDADELLCAALRENNIIAAAITDHFLIDANRIEHLRVLAPEITFFPGVELRTDKGSNNLHVIIIFSETISLEELSADFDAIMKRGCAKSKDSDDTIYWSYEDIISFAKSHDGLISIHAGKKTNGIDREISNGIPYKEAIKEDIAQDVDFFEIGKLSDIDDYYTHVFKEIKEKPLIMCSDNHNPRNYVTKEKLWIKSNPTFDGLKQCLYQPRERIYIGEIPPAYERAQSDKKSYITQISVRRIGTPKYSDQCWFDFELPINPGLVAIIGNKGSGKSALSDIIGHLCKCKTMDKASFLNNNRFRKPPRNYSVDYNAMLLWGDEHLEQIKLDIIKYDSEIESAQYLPQKYIEDICNNIDNTFQSEIDKVIFSYIDPSERSNAKDLNELVSIKTQPLRIQSMNFKTELENINNTIIKLEDKKTSQYKKIVEDSIKNKKDILDRHIKLEPKMIKKPEKQQEDTEFNNKINEVNTEIEEFDKKIKQCKNRISKINTEIDDYDLLISKVDLFEITASDIKALLDKFVIDHSLQEQFILEVKSPKNRLVELRNNLVIEKENITEELTGNETNIGLNQKLDNAQKAKEVLISNANSAEKEYQKYLSDLKKWENEKDRIIGDAHTEGTLKYFENEINYINNNLETEYKESRAQRENIIKSLYSIKEQMAQIYRYIYSPISSEIISILGNLEERIEFIAEIKQSDKRLGEHLLSQINQKYSGVFKGKTESTKQMDQYIKSTEFCNIDSVITFINNVLMAIDENIDESTSKIADKKTFYNKLCSLDYIDVSFSLRLGGRELDQLSPGERGIVLLIFYLALSKNNCPIIIDQPEDNLDNQSVYSKLVPCICAAKHKRQVIIVTHNPNIAIACDAEQIIFCHMDKSQNEISYKSGAIENPQICQNVVDVLEGTMPAFDLRRLKYIKSDIRG